MDAEPFTPCFLWVLLGAPYVEALRGVRALGAALSAVTAAVVGVILNLAVWYVGFLAGYRTPDTMPPLLAGTVAGLLVTWVTHCTTMMSGPGVVSARPRPASISSGLSQ
jgi:Chromate transporter